MEEIRMLEILNRIEAYVEPDSLDIAKDLTQLEIDNLKGITEQRCKNTKYYYYPTCCKYCSNLNCSSNVNKNVI